jgi:hypothetical protein
MYGIQDYVITFVSTLRQVDGLCDKVCHCLETGRQCLEGTDKRYHIILYSIHTSFLPHYIFYNSVSVCHCIHGAIVVYSNRYTL